MPEDDFDPKFDGEYKPVVVYLSGPMTGIRDHNKESFVSAAGVLRASGYIVLSPQEHDGGRVWSRAHHMRFDIQQVLMCDKVCVLPGWEGSEGAKVEVAVARQVGIPVVEYATGDVI